MAKDKEAKMEKEREERVGALLPHKPALRLGWGAQCLSQGMPGLGLYWSHPCMNGRPLWRKEACF